MNELKNARQLVQLMMASLIAGVSWQTYWALHHTTIGIGKRFIMATVALFIVLFIIKWAAPRMFKSLSPSFGEHFSELVLLFSTGFTYLIIFSVKIKALLMFCHILLFVYYWALLKKNYNITDVYEWVYQKLHKTWTYLTRPKLYANVEEDSHKSVVISIKGKDFSRTNQSDVKELLMQIYYDLPNDDYHETITVDITAVKGIDKKFESVLSLLQHYQKMMGVEKINFVSKDKKQQDQLLADKELEFLHPLLIQA